MCVSLDIAHSLYNTAKVVILHQSSPEVMVISLCFASFNGPSVIGYPPEENGYCYNDDGRHKVGSRVNKTLCFWSICPGLGLQSC